MPPHGNHTQWFLKLETSFILLISNPFTQIHHVLQNTSTHQVIYTFVLNSTDYLLDKMVRRYSQVSVISSTVVGMQGTKAKIKQVPPIHSRRHYLQIFFFLNERVTHSFLPWLYAERVAHLPILWKKLERIFSANLSLRWFIYSFPLFSVLQKLIKSYFSLASNYAV